MFITNLDQYIEHFEQKISWKNLKDVVAIFDFDLTLAKKIDPDNPDWSPLTEEQYLGLQRLASRVKRLVILTARGEESVVEYLKMHEKNKDGSIKHGRIPNLTLASNSGHRFHEMDIDDSKKKARIIPIDGLEDQADRDTVVANIHTMVGKLKEKFPELVTSYREMCGAVVYQVKADESRPENRFHHVQAINNYAEILLKELPEEAQKLIKFSKKSFPHKNDPNIMQGYVDIIPAKMSKGKTARWIFNHYAKNDPAAVAWIAGDSSADFDMARGLSHLNPENMHGICVGDGLVQLNDNWAATHNGRKLINSFLMGDGQEGGKDAIDFMHGVIRFVTDRDAEMTPKKVVKKVVGFMRSLIPGLRAA